MHTRLYRLLITCRSVYFCRLIESLSFFVCLSVCLSVYVFVCLEEWSKFLTLNPSSYVSEYRRLFADVGPHSEKTIEDAFFEYEVEINRLAFEYQVCPCTPPPLRSHPLTAHAAGWVRRVLLLLPPEGTGNQEHRLDRRVHHAGAKGQALAGHHQHPVAGACATPVPRRPVRRGPPV